MRAYDGSVKGDTSMAGSWAFTRPFAEVHVGQLAGRIEVTHPELGLQAIQVEAHKLDGQLLCVHRHYEAATPQAHATKSGPLWPLAVAETYLRGDDLVASYQPADDWPYSPQIYWRADSLRSFDGPVGSLSLLVSVQTHLLDTWPRISVSSHLACREALHVTAVDHEHPQTVLLCGVRTIQPSSTACCVLRRLADVPISYAEIMPASDFRNVVVRWDENGNCHVQWELFADFLEKGVIRRSRLQSVFLSRDNDVALAAACCAVIERRPLPLTT